MSKIALITGGSQGLGLAMGQNLARKGYTVLLLARTQARLEEARDSIEKSGGKAFIFPMDISDEKAMGQMTQKVKERFGRIDFLINNANILHVKTLENFSVDEIRREIEISLFGTILCTKLCLPLMEPGAKILCVSSGFGIMGAAGYPVYAATKAGMINFAEAVRREVKSRNIKVYVSIMADIDTPGARQEQESMPDWMKMAGVRGKMIGADVAAEKILRQCKGGRFYIFSHASVYSLYVMTKILPRRLRDWLLDLMFPRP